MQMRDLKTLTDEQLVTKFQQTGDNTIFGEIYNRYNKKVFKICLSYTKDRATSFDLTQDVMIKVMEKLPALENANLVGLWIHRVASNFCADYYRAQKKTQFESIEERFDLADEVTDMEVLQDRENLLDGMESILNNMDEETANILRLKYLEGHSIKELQSELNLNSSAIKMRLKRGRNQVINLYNSRKKVAIS